ncbi:MAG TPA: M56 family metallopeptidase [Lachnospiraceae bacterium]|nr:M56 family metallopeptidase [Lachnospiraceae bacterium]
MINYSFSTVLLAIIAGNVLLIFIFLLFSSIKLMVKSGFKILVLLSSLLLIRLVLPFELPVTTTCVLPQPFSYIIASIREPRYPLGNISLSLWNCFELVWILGILIQTIQFFYHSIYIRSFINKYGIDVTGNNKYAFLLKDICLSHHCVNRFHIYLLPGINTPCIWGLHKPCILLPDTYSLSDDELCFILTHETEHYFHHDFVFKLFIKIICMIYWWNPVGTIISRKVNTILEMRVDYYTSGTNKQSTDEYLQCLLHVYKLSSKSVNKYSLSPYLSSSLISFCSKSTSELRKRILILSLTKKSCSHKALRLLLIFLTLSIFILSYLFVFEASDTPQNVSQSTFSLTSKNSYIMKTEDGEYDVYYENSYFMTISSIEFFSKDIKIYNSKGEIINE